MAAQVEYLKWIPHTDFMVDGFRFQNPRCKQYFLTHYHSDHTTGLYSSFSSGVIYCSPITATLLIRKSRMPPGLVRVLEMNTRYVISGVGVTLLDANHCPGAAMMFFEIPRPSPPFKPSGAASALQQDMLRVLHVGDFRWRGAMAEEAALQGGPLDVLFLDTTYANPRHDHPPQEACIAQIAELCRKHIAEEPSTLFVIGAYGIGKERAFLGAARALGWRVWVEAGKAATMKLLRLSEEDMAVISQDKKEAKIHVTFMGRELQPERLEARRIAASAAAVVGFRPTGWSYTKSGKVQERKGYGGAVTLYGVPYSEHSSFSELRDCVATLRPRKIVPTVNVTDDPATTRRIVDMFSDLTDNSRNKGRLDSYFARKTLSPAAARPLLGSASSRGPVLSPLLPQAPAVTLSPAVAAYPSFGSDFSQGPLPLPSPLLPRSPAVTLSPAAAPPQAPSQWMESGEVDSEWSDAISEGSPMCRPGSTAHSPPMRSPFGEWGPEVEEGHATLQQTNSTPSDILAGDVQSAAAAAAALPSDSLSDSPDSPAGGLHSAAAVAAAVAAAAPVSSSSLPQQLCVEAAAVRGVPLDPSASAAASAGALTNDHQPLQDTTCTISHVTSAGTVKVKRSSERRECGAATSHSDGSAWQCSSPPCQPGSSEYQPGRSTSSRDDVAASFLDSVDLKEQQRIMAMIELRHERRQMCRPHQQSQQQQQQQQQQERDAAPIIATRCCAIASSTSCTSQAAGTGSKRKRQQTIAGYFSQKAG